MRLTSTAALFAAATAASLASAGSSGGVNIAAGSHLKRVRSINGASPQHQEQQQGASASRVRRGAPTTTLEWTGAAQTSILAQSETDPVGAAIAADSFPGVFNDTNADQSVYAYTLISGDSDSNPNGTLNQYPWFQDAYFAPNADATPGQAANSSASGWVALPQLPGFTLNRTTYVTPNATQPYYITASYDPAKVKRAVIVMPGKPRDSWKYTNLVRNALIVTQQYFPEWQANNDSVIIIGPAWLNQFDQLYGAAQPTDLVFHGSQWQSGGTSRSPNLTHSVTSYDVLDYFTDWLFDQNSFPALTSVVIAGHSMGGQGSMRYSLAKKQKRYDPNMYFFIGNPGSWTWLTEDRPVANASCEAPNEWGYGLGGNTTKVTKYFRKDVEANKTAVIERFQGRNVHYAIGQLDVGAGDTHCQAVMQGGNHLDRGAQFVQMMGSLPGGFPKSHSASFVPNASHQDYAMLSFNTSLQFIFNQGFETRLPDLTTVHNPGDKNKTAPVPKEKAFATKGHKILAASLLGGSIAGVLLAFTLLPFLFPSNADRDAQDAWEADNKKRLLSN